MDLCRSQVLLEIEYSNKKPAYYLNRVFKLTCSELNGRFTSNEYVQTVSTPPFCTPPCTPRFWITSIFCLKPFMILSLM